MSRDKKTAASYICQCYCHKPNNTLMCDGCCSECPYCGLRITSLGHMEFCSHNKVAKKIQDAIDDKVYRFNYNEE